MNYTVTRRFEELDEAYDALDDLDTGNYQLGRREPDPDDIFSDYGMPLEDTYGLLYNRPGTSHAVTLSYPDSEVEIANMIGPLPVAKVTGSLEGFESPEEFEEFVEEHPEWTEDDGKLRILMSKLSP